MRMRVSKTKKVTKKSKASVNEKDQGMTIPELRKAFEHIERIVKKGCTTDEFRKEWKKAFGKNISEEAAQDYLDFVKVDKQSGGGSLTLSPAPLGYDLRAAGDFKGSFPEYVAGGFGFANNDSIRAQCGKETWPVPVPAGGGKKKFSRKKKSQKGGALPSLGSAVAECMSRPFGMSAPPSSLQDLQSLSTGNNTLSSPRPEISNFSFTQQQPVYNAQVSRSSSTF